MRLQLLFLVFFPLHEEEEEEMMVSAADRLSMESESSSEAPASLIVGAHRAHFPPNDRRCIQGRRRDVGV